MLDFVIFAVTFVVALLIFVFCLYPGSRRPTTIPGLDPSSIGDGNLPDIDQAGSLHEFLKNTHGKFGPITGFWLADQYVVSIASPELFKEHQKAFNHPDIYFNHLHYLLGYYSVLFSNGTSARNKRKVFLDCFTDENLKIFLKQFIEIGEDLVAKMKTLPQEQHIALHSYMNAVSLKTVLYMAFGKSLKNDDKMVEFSRYFQIVWTDRKMREYGPIIDTDPPEMQPLRDALHKVQDCILYFMNERSDSKLDDICFAELLRQRKINEVESEDEITTFILNGYRTLGSMLTWTLYFLATHQEIQDKVNKELTQIAETSSDITIDIISKAKYTMQVIKESLRCAVVFPYTFRSQEIDTELGGHIIPKGTAVIHALGVVMQDEKHWPDPNVFDPERFNEEADDNAFTFCPFGFAGERTCPAERVSLLQAVVYIALISRNFRLNIVEGQVVNPNYRFVTSPEDEIWVTLDSKSDTST